MSDNEDYGDDYDIQHFALVEDNRQLMDIIDTLARSMGLESWGDLEIIVKKAKSDCDRLRKLHRIMAQESCPAIPDHLRTFDEFRGWIDRMPDIE